MQKQLFRLFFLSLIPSLLSAQITLQITSIPANTPALDQFYLAGNFNNWNAGDKNYTFSTSEPGQYSITINPAAGLLEFKITRGSWATVEGNAKGKFIPNRTLRYDGKPQTLRISIPGWEDRSTGGGGSAAPNVFILKNNFYIPQLKRERRVWVYLPPDYATAKKRYPVLYMHDGQNLFDNASSSFGEWQVDEALNKLFNQGDYGCIVVGIDNGESKRLDEYSPWKNPEYGGGEGKAYLDFVAKTLKPHIDSVYRTLPGCESTGMMGSSMGGLISMYAITERPDVFCEIGVLSPAFWFAGTAVSDELRTHPKRHPSRVYFLAGGQEPDYVETDIIKVNNAMLSAGFMPADIHLTVPPDGQHSEWFWRREFPAAYKWLFVRAVPKPGKSRSVSFDLEVSALADSQTFTIAGISPKERIQLKIVDAQGQVLYTAKQRGGVVAAGNLQVGEYTVLVKKRKGDWVLGEWKKE